MNDQRSNPIEIGREEFRKIGYQLVDQIAQFMDGIEEIPVTYNRSPSYIQSKIQPDTLPESGKPASEILSQASELLIGNSLFNGHPKFLGYITSSPAPIGVLADFLASAVNPNTGAHILSPVATEIEKQTIGWLANLIGVSTDCGGILVSGGNMANFTAFLAARTAKLPESIKSDGISVADGQITVYCSKTTHTWIEKAVTLFGFGSNSIRWIPTDGSNQMDIQILRSTIEEDLQTGCTPIMIIGTAGDVSTGVVDDLSAIAQVCKEFELWFHVDGAYGVPAAVVPEYKELFIGLEEADSIALDPHKWLYSPLEAGCTLVKDPTHLTNTFSSHPEYYHFSSEEGEFAQNFYEYGLQNSRGFRALKVWLSIKQIGRKGYEKLIREDIELAEYLFQLAKEHPELEAVSQNLSITTLRYLPPSYASSPEDHLTELNELNQAIVDSLQKGGEAFLSNAIVQDRYCLRGCVVNFRTTRKDMEEIVAIVVRTGRELNLGNS